MLNPVQTPAKAVGLAFLLCVTLIPGLAPGAPKPKADNIVYVDNVNGNDANPGTYQQPKASIQAGEDAAEALYGNDGAVVVWGGGPPYETVIITSSMKFFGNGKGLEGLPGAAPRGHLPPPVVNGGFSAFDVGSVTVKGFEITGYSGGSVAMANVGEVVCSDNFIHDIDSYGIVIPTWGSATSKVHLENNHFASMANSGGFCIFVQSEEASKVTLVASKNSIQESPSAYPFTLLTRGSAEMTAILDGNVVEEVASTVSIWAISEGNSVLMMKANGNQITGGSQVRVESSGHAHLSALVTGNTMEGSPIGGGIVGYSSDDSTLDLSASRNDTYADLSSGNIGLLGAVALGASTMNAVFENNKVDGVIGASVGDQGTVNFTATDNVIAQGIGAWATYSTGVINAAISRNQIRGAAGDGIVLQEDGTATITVTKLDGNVITGAAANGIFVDFVNPNSSVTGVQNNTVTGSAGNSLEVVNEPVSGQIKLNGKTISPLVDTP